MSQHDTQHASVYDIAGIRFLEEAAARVGLSSDVLMQRAGVAVFDTVQQHFPDCKRIAIVAGGGNNGGDGLVAASLLHQAGFIVQVWQVGQYHASSVVLADLQQQAIPYDVFESHIDFSSVDLIIDAVCGIGLVTPMTGVLQGVVDAINHAALPVLAIDVPTGIHADTGAVLGRPVQATGTLTFIGIKRGLIDAEGIQYAGTLWVNDLGVPPDVLQSQQALAHIASLSDHLKQLPKRHSNWHKGLSGHVVIVGGAPGFAGAPKMAALAALRVGAGLVSVVMHEEQAASFDCDHPEIMCHGIRNDLSILESLLQKATVVVIGPGLGTTAWGEALLQRVLEKTLPLLLDADALTLLSTMAMMRDNWVLTPHPGEAARLLHVENAMIQQHRLDSVQALAKRYGGVAVLKGARTCIADGVQCEVSLLGNPGMSTAGLGDVLSGVIGGLMAQGLPVWQAATLGVLLHGEAGDLAAQDGMRGMIATDLLPYIRRLVN